jgi:hypothetical protein
MMELLGYTRVHQKRSWQQQQWEQQQLEQILEKCAEIQKRLEKYDQTNQEIKASRLEFPTFNGKDPDSWCYRAEQFFDFYEIPERRKLAITAFHIEGKASSWFRALRTTNECITWYEFVRAMRAQFSKAEEIILLDDDSKAKESIVENSMERVEESELVLKEFEPMELDTQVESLGFVDVKPKDVHNDASLPCEFASPVMDNSFFPSKVDEYGPSVVNQEGVMSSIYNTQTDSSEMKGNKQVSDDILAKIGSKVQPKEGLKLNPVRDFDEKSDSTIEMCLPDEDSLITFDDYCFLPDEDSLITGDDFRLPSDEKSLFSPSSQVHHTEKTSGLNVTHSHENSSQLHSEHPTADRISYGFVGLEPSNHTLALREQDLVKRISTCGRLSCDEVQMFDKNLQRKLDDGVFFPWGGSYLIKHLDSWCFDLGKILFFLEYMKPEKYLVEVKLLKNFQEWKSRIVNEVLQRVQKLWHRWRWKYRREVLGQKNSQST